MVLTCCLEMCQKIEITLRFGMNFRFIENIIWFYGQWGWLVGWSLLAWCQSLHKINIIKCLIILDFKILSYLYETNQTCRKYFNLLDDHQKAKMKPNQSNRNKKKAICVRPFENKLQINDSIFESSFGQEIVKWARWMWMLTIFGKYTCWKNVLIWTEPNERKWRKNEERWAYFCIDYILRFWLTWP